MSCKCDGNVFGVLKIIFTETVEYCYCIEANKQFTPTKKIHNKFVCEPQDPIALSLPNMNTWQHVKALEELKLS